jgi:aspartyl-tRNA synthetase
MLKDKINKEITIQGFVDKIRDLQYVQFVIVRNNGFKIQVTIEKNDDNKELNELVSNLTLESTVKIQGILKENSAVKMGGMEIIPSDIIVTSKSESDLPLTYKDKDAALRETRLDYRFLDLRREDNQLIFKIQTYIEAMMMKYWLENDFYFIHTPKISKGAAEGGASMFKIDYFGTEAVLSQSPQLYKQMAMASGFSKFAEISQVYRAENSHTSYHQTEIEMIDVEISWINSVSDVMDEEERFIKSFLRPVKEKYGKELQELFKSEIEDLDKDFPRISFKDAKEVLRDKYNYVGEEEFDLVRQEEELLGKYAKEKYKSDFIFVYDYPYSARPFYTMKNEDELTTQSFDLLYKGIEITSGAMREHRLDILTKQIIEKEIDPSTLEFYLEFFKYGIPPHGGFGIGMARVIMQLFNLDNIREATFIYRGPTRLEP